MNEERIAADIADIKSQLTNHMHDYSTKFGRLKAAFQGQIEVNTARDKALHHKIDAYKWVLIIVASFTVITLGGFVALALWAINALLGGGI